MSSDKLGCLVGAVACIVLLGGMIVITGIAVAAAILENWVIAVTWPICLGGVAVALLGSCFMWREYKGEA